MGVKGVGREDVGVCKLVVTRHYMRPGYLSTGKRTHAIISSEILYSFSKAKCYQSVTVSLTQKRLDVKDHIRYYHITIPLMTPLEPFPGIRTTCRQCLLGSEFSESRVCWPQHVVWRGRWVKREDGSGKHK